MKPTDKHTRGYFPLRTKSTYTKEFINKSPKKDDYKYFNDQLKTGYNWFGKTTYGSFYNNPNPEYHAKKVKIIEKKEDNPDFGHQYGKILFTQKLYTRMTSLLRRILSVQLRYSSKQKAKVQWKVESTVLLKTLTIKHFHPNSMPSLHQNIGTSEFDCIHFKQ